MSKVDAALLGFGATGALAETLIFQNWKGISTVKAYAKPHNPRSTQQTQNRNIFAEIVLQWHDHVRYDAERDAWHVAAVVTQRPQSGFNRFISVYTALLKDGYVPLFFSNYRFWKIEAGDIHYRFHVSLESPHVSGWRGPTVHSQHIPVEIWQPIGGDGVVKFPYLEGIPLGYTYLEVTEPPNYKGQSGIYRNEGS